MRVVVTEEKLKWARSCGAHLSNPFWDQETRTLVFPDWSEAVTWYLSPSAPDGVNRLKWLVRNRLVPMTREELKQILSRTKEAGQ